MSESTTVLVQRCFAAFKAGEEGARNKLLEVTADRLYHLARKMFRDWPAVRPTTETGDLFQAAVVRLCRQLQDPAAVESPRHFFRLAAQAMRHVLTDLHRRSRHPAGRPRPFEGQGQDTSAEALDPSAASSLDPARVASWGEFHEQVGRLPEEEREVMDLLWYQGLSHEEAAAVLGVSMKTVQRRFRNAKVALYDALGGAPPGL